MIFGFARIFVKLDTLREEFDRFFESFLLELEVTFLFYLKNLVGNRFKGFHLFFDFYLCFFWFIFFQSDLDVIRGNGLTIGGYRGICNFWKINVITFRNIIDAFILFDTFQTPCQRVSGLFVLWLHLPDALQIVGSKFELLWVFKS